MSMPYLNISLESINVIILLLSIVTSVILSINVIKHNRKLWIATILFDLYFIILVLITTSDNPNPSGVIAPVNERLDLLPFIDIFNAVKYNIPHTYIQFLLNLIMFIPFGLLLPILWSNVRSWLKISLLALGLSLIIELIQLLWVNSNRIFEVNDLICNTAGALVGFSLWKLYMLCRGKFESRKLSWVFPIVILVLFSIVFIRPFICFDSDMPMISTSRYIPKKVIGTNQLYISNLDDNSYLPIYSVKINSDTYLTELCGNYGLFNISDLENIKTDYISKIQQYEEVISTDDALQRASLGIVIDAYSTYYLSTPEEVMIDNAQLCYMLNKNCTQLRPVWYLSGKITKYNITNFWIEDGAGNIRYLTEGEDNLLTDECLHIDIIIPAEK